jgi:hypothetical protein
MKKLLMMIVMALLAACAPVEGALPTETLPPSETPAPSTTIPTGPVFMPTEEPMNGPSAVEKVRLQVAANLGYARDDVILLESLEVTFRDGCLDAALADEMCIQVLTPGFRVLFDTPGGEMWYHLSQDGSIFRQAPANYEPLIDPQS